MQTCLGYAMERRNVPTDRMRRIVAETGNFSALEMASVFPGQLFAMAGMIAPIAVTSYRQLAQIRTILIVKTQDPGSAASSEK